MLEAETPKPTSKLVPKADPAKQTGSVDTRFLRYRIGESSRIGPTGDFHIRAAALAADRRRCSTIGWDPQLKPIGRECARSSAAGCGTASQTRYRRSLTHILRRPSGPPHPHRTEISTLAQEHRRTESRGRPALWQPRRLSPPTKNRAELVRSVLPPKI